MTTEDRIVRELSTARESLEVAAALLQESGYPYAAAIVRSALQLTKTELKFFIKRGVAGEESEDGAGRVDEVPDMRTTEAIQRR